MQEQELSKINPELASKIQKIVEEGNSKSDAKKYKESSGIYLTAWELLPEKKANWDLAQWISMSLFQDKMAVGEFAEAKRWALLSYEARPSDIDFASLIDLGWVCLELNELDEAFRWFSNAYEIEGRAAFSDYPSKLYKFFSNMKKGK